MLNYLVAYGASAIVFLVMDFIWLTVASRLLYRPMLGDLLAENPKLAIAALFYLVYVIGIVVFAVMPAFSARSLVLAIGLGALLGLVAYGTYDITNLSTIEGWPVAISIIDMIWGMTVTATAALVGFLALRAISGSG